MATSKYSDIEIQTAKNLMEQGYKWLYRSGFGTLYAYQAKPLINEANYDVHYDLLCKYYVPIFQSVKSCDEPVSLESIVHPQILDDVERRYLSAVIRPFRVRVQYIAKSFADDARFYRINCYIFIHFNDGSDDMDFPLFNESKMYKGMKRYKAYTLEELGL